MCGMGIGMRELLKEILTIERKMRAEGKQRLHREKVTRLKRVGELQEKFQVDERLRQTRRAEEISEVIVNLILKRQEEEKLLREKRTKRGE